MKSIHIKNGLLIDPVNKVNQIGDLYIADGKIVSVIKAPYGFKADEIIDATGTVTVTVKIILQLLHCICCHICSILNHSTS